MKFDRVRDSVSAIRILGFVPLPAVVMISLALITIAYVLAAEATKSWFYRSAAVTATLPCDCRQRLRIG